MVAWRVPRISVAECDGDGNDDMAHAPPPLRYEDVYHPVSYAFAYLGQRVNCAKLNVARKTTSKVYDA